MSGDYLYQKRWRLDRERGVKRLVDAAPATVHAEQLLMAGASVRAIADAAGVSASTVSRLTRRRPSQTKAAVAAAILAVTLDDTLDRQGREDFVLKVGAVRRIQALMTIGHRAQDIALTGHLSAKDVYNIVNQQGRWISHARHVGVKAAYADLSMTPGPSETARRRSAAKGWLAPLAWDEEDIDDPNAAPTEVDPPKRSRIEDLIEDVEHLLNSGTALASIPARVGYGNAKDLSRVMYRAGRKDLGLRLVGAAEGSAA